MTSQLLMSNRSATISRSQTTGSNPQMVTTQALSTNPVHNETSMKSIYQADQQVKFLHLQAEVETLLLELQTLKQHRLSALTQDPSSRIDTANDSN
ncbi:hypothetical protein [Kamptonema sp. UHCC 0994]|uniref:hypothetical protein n=1 Tax=Kamptonema sp. UHCC 0994 TaxID=3031329 RepID=UPI0023BA8B1F|nr:hypothetical protein [Kamptonema sp. UHCC 0994]MDF0556798.1 hypothetical protein [Kamptonema sp. UHCC 0994]